MKTKLILMMSSIVAVLSPVAPMIYVALISILLDTCFGVWRSVKKNGWASFKSRRLSSTLSLYFTAELYALCFWLKNL